MCQITWNHTASQNFQSLLLKEAEHRLVAPLASVIFLDTAMNIGIKNSCKYSWESLKSLFSSAMFITLK